MVVNPEVIVSALPWPEVALVPEEVASISIPVTWSCGILGGYSSTSPTITFSPVFVFVVTAVILLTHLTL